MQRGNTIIIAIIVALTWVLTGSAFAGQKEEMLYPSAQVIVGDRANGSATAVKVDAIMGTYLLTNYHVVQGKMDSLTVSFYGKDENHPAYVHSIDPHNDLAVIITRHKHDYVATIGKPPDVFDEAVCVGSSFGEDLAPSFGHITGTDVLRFGTRFMTRTDCNIAPGNSGGGLFVKQDDVWKLVGVPAAVKAVGTFGAAIPISFLGLAVRIEEVRWHLYRHGVLRLPPLTSGSSPR